MSTSVDGLTQKCVRTFMVLMDHEDFWPSPGLKGLRYSTLIRSIIGSLLCIKTIYEMCTCRREEPGFKPQTKWASEPPADRCAPTAADSCCLKSRGVLRCGKGWSRRKKRAQSTGRRRDDSVSVGIREMVKEQLSIARQRKEQAAVWCSGSKLSKFPKVKEWVEKGNKAPASSSVSVFFRG